MDLQTFVATVTIWLAIYAICKVVLTKLLSTAAARSFIPEAKARRTLQSELPAYAVSTLHAFYVAARGAHHLAVMMRAPPMYQLYAPREHQIVPPEHLQFDAECTAVVWTNIVLGSYLAADMIHVVRHYPRLGKWDTLLHHVAFVCCALVAGRYKMFPLLFSWLIVGESSTPFLNLRWFLIKAGRGSSTFFGCVEKSFAVVFILTRFFIYAAGLAYQFTILNLRPDEIPVWAMAFCMFWVVAGFLLNLVWIKKILSLGKTRPKPTATHTSQTCAKQD